MKHPFISISIFISMLCIGIFSSGCHKPVKAPLELTDTFGTGSILIVEDNKPANIIRPGEITDTTFMIKKDSKIDFDWILRQLYDIQLIGRENLKYTDEMYDAKLLLRQWAKKYGVSYDIPTLNQNHDTIFIEETMITPYKLTYAFWKDLKNTSVYLIMPITIKTDPKAAYPSPMASLTKDFSDSPYYNLINTWQKDSLQLLQDEKESNYDFDLDLPYSTCISRVIVTPDSVKFDMIKLTLNDYFHSHWFID